MRIPAGIALAIAMLSGAPAFAQNNPPAPKTVDLGGGISVIMGQGGNIGVSSGADGAFVIDDQYPNTAAANLEKIKQISGGAPRYLVNTHWHGDHAGGNAAFAQAGAMIFAHENVRKRLSGEVKSLGLNGQPAAASPEPAWPVITFVDGVDFHLNDETIRVFKVRAGHTDGDSMIHFVEPDILHMGDVFFNGLFPVIDPGSGGSVRGYLEAMKDTLKIVDANTKIIPGHGDMGTKADLEKQIAMLDGAVKAVEARIKAGDTLQQTIAKKPLKPWASFAWSFIGEDAFTTTLYNGLK
jgi:cyclase